MNEITIQKIICCTLWFNVVVHSVPSDTQFMEDMAKYSIFSKTGNYDEVRNILKQLRAKDRTNQGPFGKLNDFLLKSSDMQQEQIQNDAVPIDDGTELSQNYGFLEHVYEGDIVLTVPQARYLLDESNGRRKRKVMRDPAGRWPTKTINYAFDSSINPAKRVLIEAGIKHWQDNTCLKFQESSEGDHLLFVSGTGCFSNVGHVGGVQEVSLGPGCDQLGVVAHEIGHILGFWHEQSRPDRGEYIRINYGNVIKNAEGNFDRLSMKVVDYFGVAYDLGSALHYGAYAFSAHSDRPTISTLDPNYMFTVGQRQRLSYIDIKQMNRVYCMDVCKSFIPCQHGGFQDTSEGGTKCNTCKCPDGFGGTYCETVQPSRNQTSGNCGGELVAQDQWQTISFSGVEKECNWLIRAPSNRKIVFEIPNVDLLCQEVCKYGFVEVKYNVNFEQTGARFCCSGTRKPIVSATNELIALYRVGSQGKPSSSFNARYKLGYENGLPTFVQPFTRSPTNNGFHQEQPMAQPMIGLPPEPVPPQKPIPPEPIPTQKPLSPEPAPTPKPRPPESVPILPQKAVSFWSDWTRWSICSDVCGGCGISERRRKCVGGDCPGYDLQRANCNNQVCATTQNDAMCSYPQQVNCNQMRRQTDQPESQASSLDQSNPVLFDALPDFVGGHVNAGPEVRRPSPLHYFRRRRQEIHSDAPVINVPPVVVGSDSSVVVVKPAESRHSISGVQQNDVYCVRYVQYPCNSNSVWKMQDSPPRSPCCSGYDQIGNVCKKKN